jgi:parallel beta-helix repeat protein
MSKEPVAFMSYVRADDAHDAGRLTQFCERLASEVRMQTGEEFPIFQDRKDIAWGQQWKSRIEGALDAITFLVPIITPGFFKSPPCREELERFLDREKKLGRNDLIFPVYYVATDVLDEEGKRSADPLASAIASRQYADWRELRFEPFTAPAICKTLVAMARQIMQAMKRGQTSRQSSPGGGKETQPVAARPSPAATNATEAVLPARDSTPTVKTEPRTLVVDAFHRGDHTSVTDALQAAQPGDWILVRPGTYYEGIVIDKVVEIIGDGEVEDIVIVASGKDTVLARASMGRLANVSLKQAGGGDYHCVDIAQGRVDIEGCDISSQSLACVAIHGSSDPCLRRNRIHDGKSAGVMVYENGQGTLEDNEIFANTLSGVQISGCGAPTLRRNRIHDGKAGGVMVYENGKGTLEDNEIFANDGAGVLIKEGGAPTLRRNRIHDGKGTGVLVSQNGQGTLEDNETFANAGAGVAIREGGTPTLRRNRIHDGKVGVLVFKKGQGTLEDNEIFANVGAGGAISGGGAPTLRRNRIRDNSHVAVSVSEGGKGMFEDNDLRGNKRGAWSIEAACVADVKRARNQE